SVAKIPNKDGIEENVKSNGDRTNFKGGQEILEGIIGPDNNIVCSMKEKTK
ncbi:unnamed protein product, partial [marine sediment metagenome]